MSEGEDEVVESMISARLRRLREEGDALQFDKRPDQIAMPAGHVVRKLDAQPSLVTEERDVVDSETGEIKSELFSEVLVRNQNAGPFENIVGRGWILRKGDEETMRGVRIKAALRFRGTFEAGQVSPLKAQNYGAMGGGGGGVPRPVADGVIDSIHALKRLEEAMPADLYRAVTQVVCMDVWIWEGKKGGAIAKDVELVLRGIDHLAALFGYITAADVRKRWERQPA